MPGMSKPRGEQVGGGGGRTRPSGAVEDTDRHLGGIRAVADIFCGLAVVVDRLADELGR